MSANRLKWLQSMPWIFAFVSGVVSGFVYQVRPINGEIILIAEDAPIYFGILSSIYSLPIAAIVSGLTAAGSLKNYIENSIDKVSNYRSGPIEFLLKTIIKILQVRPIVFWFSFAFSLIINGFFSFLLLRPLLGEAFVIDAVGHLKNLGLQIGPLLWAAAPFSLIEIVSLEDS